MRRPTTDQRTVLDRIQSGQPARAREWAEWDGRALTVLAHSHNFDGPDLIAHRTVRDGGRERTEMYRVSPDGAVWGV